MFDKTSRKHNLDLGNIAENKRSLKGDWNIRAKPLLYFFYS